jgi:hypothetical protein
VQRRSTNALEGAQIDAAGSAHAVGICVEGAPSEAWAAAEADGEALDSGGDAEAAGGTVAAVDGSGFGLAAPPHDNAARETKGRRRRLVTRAA